MFRDFKSCSAKADLYSPLSLFYADMTGMIQFAETSLGDMPKPYVWIWDANGTGADDYPNTVRPNDSGGAPITGPGRWLRRETQVQVDWNAVSGVADILNQPSLAAVATSGNKSDIGLGNVDNTSDANKPVSTAQAAAISEKEPTIAAGTTAQYWRGDKSWQPLPSSPGATITPRILPARYMHRPRHTPRSISGP